MRKFNIVLVLMLTVCMLFGCGTAMPMSKNSKKMNVVATIFPAYDWAKNVAGDNADITLLLDSGVDLHNYQPTAQDILKITQADVFIYVGGESDEWVEDVLRTADNKDLTAINLSEVLASSLKEEELVEGMEGHDHEHEHEDGEEHDHEDGEDHEEGEEHEHEHEHEEGEVEYDEHVWLSIKNAISSVNAIKDTFVKVDSKNKDAYTSNASSYVKKLSELDNKYESVRKNAKVDTVLFADRFPFRYMVEDYNLTYYAAFIGCSAETEASFETISFLSNKVDELGLKYIYKLEGRNSNIADTVAKTAANTPEILTIDSMQSITGEDVKNGTSYIKIMEDNLKVFEKGLNNE